MSISIAGDGHIGLPAEMTSLARYSFGNGHWRVWILAAILAGFSSQAVAQEDTFAAMLAAAEAGDVDSQIALAHSLRGTGPELGGYEAAAQWYQTAAEAGAAEAQLELGKLILNGAVAQAPEAGIAWLEQAAENSAEAAFELGMAYEFGRGVVADVARASELYRTAAEADVAAAATRLGQLLETGALGTVEEDEAIRQYQRAAGLGEPAGTFALGRAHEFGLGALDVNASSAMEYYRTASQLGDGEASYRLGQLFETGDLAEVNYTAAFQAYSLAAAQGHVEAHVAKGRFLETGLGTEPSQAGAYREYKAAADLGSEAGSAEYERLLNELLENDSTQNFVEVEVLFVTDRAPREPGQSDPRFFANIRDPNSLVHAGSLDVRVAVDPDEAANRDSRRFRSNGNTSPEDVGDPSHLDGATFRQAVQNRLADFDNRILVFVHGYWNSFEKATAAAAQLAWDLKLPGLPVIYSWPSKNEGPVKSWSWPRGIGGCLKCYFTDEKTVFWSALNHFPDFIAELREAAPDAEIAIIAHSMGNRLLLAELEAGVIIDEVIMAAPDVPEPWLREKIGQLKARTGRVSIYAAKWDWALSTAAWVDDYDRAGSTSGGIPVFVSDEAQTLDATEVADDALGHSYVYSSAMVIDDLQTIIAQHAQPAEAPRVWLEGKSLPPDYWVFTP